MALTMIPAASSGYSRSLLALSEDPVTTKEKVQALLARLPDDCSLEDVLYHLYVIQAIDRGLVDAEAGRTISQEEVAEEMRRKWVLGAAQ